VPARGWATGLLAAAALAVAAPAPAQVPGDAVRAVPNTAGAGSHLIGDFRVADDPQSGGQSPRQIFINVAAGFKTDSRARSETCSEQQAAAFDCPENSKIGAGFATATLITGAFAPLPLVADMAMFLAPPQQPGDVAGAVLQATVRNSGQRATTTGRVVKLSSPYAFGLWFENLDPLTSGLPPGFRVDRIYGDNGASRTVKTKRYDLITNPQTCPSGGWPYSVRLVYPNGAESVRDASTDCSS
jgi:hypothetical protein